MKTQIKKELDRIYEEHKILRPKNVVECAKDKSSILHNYFEWNNKTAGAAYRLWQARELITEYTILVEISKEVKLPIQAFVSLKSDRQNLGGGYRKIKDILTNKQMREELLKQALSELIYFQQKYKQLTELVPVFNVIDMIIKRKRRKVA